MTDCHLLLVLSFYCTSLSMQEFPLLFLSICCFSVAFSVSVVYPKRGENCASAAARFIAQMTHSFLHLLHDSSSFVLSWDPWSCHRCRLLWLVQVFTKGQYGEASQPRLPQLSVKFNHEQTCSVHSVNTDDQQFVYHLHAALTSLPSGLKL